MESRVLNLESKIDDVQAAQEKFSASQEEFRSTQNSILYQLQTHGSILHQLQSFMARCNGGSIGESFAATPMPQPFVKMTSPISLVKSNQVVLKLQTFHEEKIRAREKVEEFWSKFRPRYKPKSPPCLRPILKKFKRVRDYAKYHEDGSARFRSSSKFQGSFGFFRSELARKNEKVFGLLDKPVDDSVKSPPFLDSDCKKSTEGDLVSGLPISDLLEKKDELPSSLSVLEIVASKLLAKIGEDSLLCDQTFDIASLKLGFHEFIRDKGGTNIQRLFHSKSATVLESDGKNGKSQVFILEIHVSNVEFKKAQLPGSRALYLFDKMSNSGYIFDIKLGYHTSIRDKGGTKFLSSFELRDLLASCEDSSCCVGCDVVLDRDYCKGIRDKGGGKLDYGLQLFKKMRIHDVFSWTSVITTYVWTGQEDRAIKAFIRMQEACVSPNEYTFAGVISRVANLARVEWGEQLHAHVLHRGLISLLSVGNFIVTMHAKCGRLVSGSKVFHEMSRRDIVSWSTLIGRYSQGGYGKEAFQFLSWMRRDGPKTNEFALASVLSVCGSMAMLEQGKQLHAHVLSVGLEVTSMVQSALVNMHSKCGSITEVAKIFDLTELSDINSWTAVINGYAEHVEHVACCHAGLVHLGFHYNSMSNDFGINPAKEHYGCMVDLLYQAGRLGEILKLDPSSAATHITLATMYAAKGKWREVVEVRKMMRSKRVIKEQGWSWIKVKDRLSAFVAGDRSHPQVDDIYSVLKLLASKAEDTIQKIGSSLIDVEG